MPQNRGEIREELLAVLAAHRELPPETDSDLADVFLRRLDGKSMVEAGQDQNLQARVTDALSRTPVSMAQVVRVGAIEALATAFVGFVIISLFGIDTNNDNWIPNAMPLWDSLAIIWLLQIAITVALVAWVQRGRRPHSEENLIQ